MFACTHSLDRQPGLLIDQPRGARRIFDLAPALVLVNPGLGQAVATEAIESTTPAELLRRRRVSRGQTMGTGRPQSAGSLELPALAGGPEGGASVWPRRRCHDRAEGYDSSW
jgi:hypothetical protein